MKILYVNKQQLIYQIDSMKTAGIQILTARAVSHKHHIYLGAHPEQTMCPYIIYLLVKCYRSHRICIHMVMLPFRS